MKAFGTTPNNTILVLTRMGWKWPTKRMPLTKSGGNRSPISYGSICWQIMQQHLFHPLTL